MAVSTLCLCMMSNYAQAQLLTGFDNDNASVFEQEPITKPEPLAKEEYYQRPLTNPDAVIEEKKIVQGKPVVKNTIGPDAGVMKRSTGFLTSFGNVASSIKNVGGNTSTNDQNSAPPEGSEPVDLQADSIVNDEDAQTVTATGNVMVVQTGRILRADEITYDIANDKVIAKGYVVLNEPNGDIHTADYVELQDQMKNGFVDSLKTYLADGSRFEATKGRRKNGVKTIMEQASYTPCEPCKKNPDRPVVWQIRASKVTHDEEDNTIAYNNARFEFFGVPIAYTPYFSHPDGTIDRKSGLLTPTFGLDSELGVNVGTRYYWNIAPDKDATIGLRAFTDQLPLMTAEWRQRWDTASLVLDGGVTYSERDDRINGETFRTDEELRGHLFAEGLWDINRLWRAGLDVEYSSDDQYLRQYDFSAEDVLTSQIYAERFQGRHYSSARLINFQDTRVGDLQDPDQPDVLPEIASYWVGEPGDVPLIGGRWEVGGSTLGLRRDGDGQNVGRLSLNAGWERRLVSDIGLLTSLDANIRGDFYRVENAEFATATSAAGEDLSDSRIFPQFHVQSSYPLAREFDGYQVTISPQVALTLAPNLDADDEIPNEDSQNVQLDSSNLFERNRFPGLDRVEDKSRVTYGVRTGAYGYEGSYAEIFLGQSHRLDEDDNPFPAGSGLNNQQSDFVGEINANYQDNYDLSYRFQLAQDNLAPTRHELDALANFGDFNMGLRYLYANALEGTELDESREQVAGDFGYDWNENWRSTFGAVQDLGESPGLRTAYIGLDHFGQCFSWGLTAQRSLTDDATGDSRTTILFRIGLKNLGEFQASGIELGGSGGGSTTEDDDDNSTDTSL